MGRRACGLTLRKPRASVCTGLVYTVHTSWQKLSTQVSSHSHLLSLSHHPGGLVVTVVASSVVVKGAVIVVSVVVDVALGASVQLALPVLQPLQFWNGLINCDSR